MTVEEVAQQLYAALPEQFVAARDDAVRRARADGDPELAAQLAQLRRPTAGAWLANLLVREHRAEVTELVDLGTALREAQESLDGVALRDLARQRQQVVTGLVALARRQAAAHGNPVGPGPAADLESTLVAALADPEAAAQLLAGRLATGLSYAGLGLGGEVAQSRHDQADRGAHGPAGRVGTGGGARGARTHRGRPEAPATPAGGGDVERAARVDDAERALAAARLAEAEADDVHQRVAQAHAAADEAVDAARHQLTQAEAALTRAKAELAAARERVERAEADRAQTAGDSARAKRERAQAARAVAHARAALDRLTRAAP